MTAIRGPMNLLGAGEGAIKCVVSQPVKYKNQNAK